MLGKVIVLGAGGQLGSELMRQLPPETTLGLTHGQLDICDHERVRVPLKLQAGDNLMVIAWYRPRIERWRRLRPEQT